MSFSSADLYEVQAGHASLVVVGSVALHRSCTLWELWQGMSYRSVKRLLDIIFSTLGLIVLFPVMFLVSIAVKLDSPGPVIFKQDRLGLNGRVFTMYKFRSMCVGAEKSGVYESARDSRVTRVGKFIRRTSIDELPQLLNVLKGDMSLVGPRPPLTYHPWPYEQYSQEQKRMFEVRPGITGWAQVNGRKNLEWPRRIDLNIEYVDKMSLKFDLVIILKTFWKVLTMRDNVNSVDTVVKKLPIERALYGVSTG